MTTLVTRHQWGAVPPKGVSYDVNPTGGVAIHHVGGGSYAYADHASCVSLVKAIQRMHLANTAEGYADIAYNLLACHHGYMFEGRSKASDPKVRPGSNGSTYANTVALSVCCLWGDADGAPSAGILGAAAGAVAWLRAKAGAATRVTGHRDWSSTSCPGHLYAKLGTIKALADRGDRPSRDDPRPSRDIIVATYNAPSRYGLHNLHGDCQGLADKHGVSLIALQETTDSSVKTIRPDGWDWWRPARARSSSLTFDLDVWRPVLRSNGNRRQGAVKISSPKAPAARFIVWAALEHKATGEEYRFGGFHLVAGKYRSVARAREFLHQEAELARWLRGGPRRVALGDLNGNRGLWTPNLRRDAVWQSPRLATKGRKRIDHVLRPAGRPQPTTIRVVPGHSDHDALIVRL